MHATRLLPALAALGLTACGNAATTATGSTQATAAASEQISTSLTVTSTATPVPSAPPLLAVAEAAGSGLPVVRVYDAQGHAQWSVSVSALHLPQPHIGAAGAPVSDAAFATGGGSLYVYGGGTVWLFDRTGRVTGGGNYDDTAGNTRLLPGPDGHSWAYDRTVYAAPPSSVFTDDIFSGGVGVAEHRLAHFSGDSASATATHVNLVEWSDRGLVLQELTGACGGGAPVSSELLDPQTGAPTPLYGADRLVEDVHAGVTASLAAGTTDTVRIGGAHDYAITFVPRDAGQHAQVGSLAISPDGARVAVPLTEEAGCGGFPREWTELIDVGTGAHTLAVTRYARGWYDSTHLVVSDNPNDGDPSLSSQTPASLYVCDSSGQGMTRVASMGSGYVGTL